MYFTFTIHCPGGDLSDQQPYASVEAAVEAAERFGPYGATCLARGTIWATDDKAWTCEPVATLRGGGA